VREREQEGERHTAAKGPTMADKDIQEGQTGREAGRQQIAQDNDGCQARESGPAGKSWKDTP